MWPNSAQGKSFRWVVAWSFLDAAALVGSQSAAPFQPKRRKEVPFVRIIAVLPGCVSPVPWLTRLPG